MMRSTLTSLLIALSVLTVHAREPGPGTLARVRLIEILGKDVWYGFEGARGGIAKVEVLVGARERLEGVTLDRKTGEFLAGLLAGERDEKVDRRFTRVYDFFRRGEDESVLGMGLVVPPRARPAVRRALRERGLRP